MADAHQRYERLAVGHVVGGLDEVDAARFRSHLTGCEPCRSRVSELRDIASTLAATEREERGVRSGSTEVTTRPDQDAPPRVVEVAPWRAWPWRAVVIGVIPILVLLILAWTVWVRTENQILSVLAAVQQDALELIASGDEVGVVTSSGVEAEVATDAMTVVAFLTGLPELGPDQGVVLWLLDDVGTPMHVSDPLLRARVAGGRVLLTVPRPANATELIISIERLPSELTVPTGLRVAAGPLPAMPPVAVDASG